MLTAEMILASGCFDGLHAGHVRYLQASAALNPQQALWVAIAPDSYIVMHKSRTAFWLQADRAATVYALGCVDHVVCHQDDTPAALIRQIKPRVFAKGSEWRGRIPEEVVAACQAVGCEIRYVDTPGRHTEEARTG